MWPSFSYVLGLRVDYLSPTIYVTDILLGCSIISLLTQKSIRENLNSFLGRNKKVVYLLGVFFCCNLIFSYSPPSTLYGIYKLLEMTGFFFLLTYFYRKVGSSISLLYVPFLLGGLVQGVLAVLQFFYQGSVGGLWYYLGERTFSGSTPGIANASLFGHLILRPYGTFPHPNLLAAYELVTCAFLVTLLRVRQQSPIERSIVFLLLLFTYSVLLLTLSRICIVLSIIGAVIFISTQKAKKIPYGIFIVLGMSIIGVLFLSYLYPRFASIFSDQAYADRIAYMSESVRLFLNHPIIGVGWNAYLPSLATLPSVGLVQPVHSIFLLYLVECGLVGVVVLLRMLYRYWVCCKPSIRTSSVIVCLMIVGIGMFDHYLLTLQQGQLLFALLLSLVHKSNSVIKK